MLSAAFNVGGHLISVAVSNKSAQTGDDKLQKR